MYNDIIEFLDNKRLKEALVQLTALAHEADNWQLSSEIESLQTTYSYMLQYAAQGMEDPERNKLYHQLLRTAYELADRTEATHKYRTGTGYMHGKTITVFSKFHHILIRKSVSVLKLSAKIWEWLR